MHLRPRTAVLALLAFLSGCTSTTRPLPPSNEFQAAAARAFTSPDRACLVLVDASTRQTRVMNTTQADRRFPPASTFKIPNSLIGLHTGVIPAPDHVIPWDGTPHEREINNRNHSLRSAFAYSVVWYYQQLARRVGQPRMQQLLESLHYGNADSSSGLTTFWLRGSLRISAHEQIAFLTSIHTAALPVSTHALEGLKDIMILAQGPGWTYRGKTGTYSGPVDGVHSDLGWFVGWIERDGRSLFFAANDSTGLTGPDVRERVQQVLVDLRELPADWESHARQVNPP